MKAMVAKQSVRVAGTKVSKKAFEKLKDIDKIIIGVHYTTKSEPGVLKGKDFVFDVEKGKESIKKITNKFKRGEKRSMSHQYKVIWLNEMGEEQVELVNSEEERNQRLQVLADEGYSPVWRPVTK